jgi:hypothetical protein
VKLLSPKINPIIAHQNCVALRSSIGTFVEDSGAQRIRIRISPNGVRKSQTEEHNYEIRSTITNQVNQKTKYYFPKCYKLL